MAVSQARFPAREVAAQQPPNPVAGRPHRLGVRQLAGTEGGRFPTFSPNADWVAFSLGGPTGTGGIAKVSVEGGPVLPLTSSGLGPHWGLDDTIVYTAGGGRLYRVSAAGGEPQLLLDSDSLRARTPYLLPNGKAVIFSLATSADISRILILELETGAVRELVELYIAQTSDCLARLSDAIGAREAESVQFLAHSCKGSSANYGMMAVAQTMLELEQLGRGGQLDGAESLIRLAEKQLAHIAEYCEKHL